MKGKWYVGILIAAFIVVVGGIALAVQKNVVVNAPQTILSSQNFSVTSSHELAGNSISKGLIYVTNEKGEKVDVTVRLNELNQIQLSTLKEGSFKMHIKKKAFLKAPFFTKGKTIQFNVINQLTHLSTEEELKTHFKKILEKEKQNEKYMRSEQFSMSSGLTTESIQDQSESEYSQTNNQVAGIEEGDSTLTDGQTIFTISNNTIFFTDIRTPSSMKIQAKIQLPQESYVSEMVLHENYLIVSYTDYSSMEASTNGEMIYLSKLAIYDISNKKNPQKIREIGQEGDIIAVRKINNFMYFITQNTPNYWLLREEKNTNLKPSVYDSKSKSMRKLNNDEITILPNSEEALYTIISTIDLNNNDSEKVETEAYLGGGVGFYMSHDAMYLTASKYNNNAMSRALIDIAFENVATETTIYRFKVDGLSVVFSGQNVVPGNILNQFSMDEHNGYFRVAATDGNTRGENATSSSAIYIFNENMVQTGVVKDLAKGERIYSARFLGDKAFIVTFKEMDPLFAFDLSDPSNPKVLGELKIPGYSTYLHPIDETHLLGLGFNTEVQNNEFSSEPTATQVGLKLALFDVSDLTNPIEQDKEILGDSGTYSQAIHNHKAFFIYKEKNLYGFPIDYMRENNYNVIPNFTAAMFKVTAENGIELLGHLNSENSSSDWDNMAQRIIYVGTSLYLIRNRVIESYNLEDLSYINNVKLK